MMTSGTNREIDHNMVHFTLFGSLIHSSPFPSTLGLQPLAVVMVVLLIEE